jgi:hypothetical protein
VELPRPAGLAQSWNRRHVLMLQQEQQLPLISRLELEPAPALGPAPELGPAVEHPPTFHWLLLLLLLMMRMRMRMWRTLACHGRQFLFDMHNTGTKHY